MRVLRDVAEDYLRMRRALGYKLEIQGLLLNGFISYLEQAGAATVTIENAVAWATLPAGADPSYWAGRLSVVRKASTDNRPGLRGSARAPAALPVAASDPLPLRARGDHGADGRCRPAGAAAAGRQLSDADRADVRQRATPGRSGRSGPCRCR
jgi:hypothetical protein